VAGKKAFSARLAQTSDTTRRGGELPKSKACASRAIRMIRAMLRSFEIGFDKLLPPDSFRFEMQRDLCKRAFTRWDS
jgi:hypothetical protein